MELCSFGYFRYICSVKHMGELIEGFRDNGRISGNAVLVFILLSTLGINIAQSSMDVSNISFGTFNTTHATDEDGSHQQNITSSQHTKAQKSSIKNTIKTVFQPKGQGLNNFKKTDLIQAITLDEIPFLSTQHAYLSLFYLF